MAACGLSLVEMHYICVVSRYCGHEHQNKFGRKERVVYSSDVTPNTSVVFGTLLSSVDKF